jgi:hypothetical protein
MMVNDFLLVGLVIFFFSQTTLASNADSYELTERLRSYVNHRLGVEKMQVSFKCVFLHFCFGRQNVEMHMQQWRNGKHILHACANNYAGLSHA